jgi:hypothetical protein
VDKKTEVPEDTEVKQVKQVKQQPTFEPLPEEVDETPLDEQSQKALNNATFNPDDLVKSSAKTDKKGGKGPSKKGKNKGVDFHEYAQKNGINVNIQYEAKSDVPKKDYTANKPNVNQKPSNDNSFKPKGKFEKFQKFDKFDKFGGKKNYNTEGGQGGQGGQKVQGSNKFDAINNNMMQSPFYYQQSMNMQRPDLFQDSNTVSNSSSNMGEVTSGMDKINMDDNLDADQKIMNTLEYYFSIENLNKDYFFRKQLDENGYINAEIITTFNTMKKHNVTKEKIGEILKTQKFNGIIEMSVKDDVLNLRNKNWETVKDKLLPLEAVKELKDASKKLKPSVQNNNYVSMQNNYYYQFHPGQHSMQHSVNPYQYSQMNYPNPNMQQMYGQHQQNMGNMNNMNQHQNNNNDNNY